VRNHLHPQSGYSRSLLTTSIQLYLQYLYHTPLRLTIFTMSEKRKRGREEGDAGEKKRPNRGFQVGPQNLPDGVYKRKST
jgi:hypothetical protein